jgi:hypothetical protein
MTPPQQGMRFILPAAPALKSLSRADTTLSLAGAWRDLPR